jgi:hypothetical protein
MHNIVVGLVWRKWAYYGIVSKRYNHTMIEMASFVSQIVLFSKPMIRIVFVEIFVKYLIP